MDYTIYRLYFADHTETHQKFTKIPVDRIIPHDCEDTQIFSKVIPIELKSGDKYTTISKGKVVIDTAKYQTDLLAQKEAEVKKVK
jgi:hypothetical protein